MNATDGFLAYVVGPSIVTLGSVTAAKFASRGTVKAAQTTAEQAKETGAVSGYHELVSDLRQDVNRLRQDYDSLRTDHEEVRRHVKSLEDQATRDKSLIRHLILYIRALRDEIQRLGGTPVEAPADLDDRISTWPVL